MAAQANCDRAEQARGKRDVVGEDAWEVTPLTFLTQPPTSFPLTAVSLLSVYESVSILSVSSACSLDSMY